MALVTGAGSGIGQTVAVRLPAEGATVVGCDVDQDGLDLTAKQIEDDGHHTITIIADITDQADVDRVVAAVPGDRIDLPANVAAIMDHFVPVTDLDDALWDRVLAVNLTGPMRLSRAVLPLMRAAGIGATAAPTVPWAYQRLERSFGRITRMAQPDEIATLICWLGSDEAVNVNGAVVTSDGGWTS